MDTQQDVQIEFRDGLTAEQRAMAEESVATMLARSQEEGAKARAEDADRARLEAAASAPLARPIYEDPEASAALKELGEMEIRLDPLDARHERVSEPRGETLFDFMAPLPAGPIEEKRAPFDYTWSWALGGAPNIQRFFPPSGFVALGALSGDSPGGADSFVEAHAGYGVALSTDHPIRLVGRVETSLDWQYSLGTAAPGSWADAEGGIDITAFEDPAPGKPPLADSTKPRLWRAHKASEFPFTPDTEDGSGGPVTVWDPWGNITFQMRPGHGYTFNVGVRAFANHGGLNAAAASGMRNTLIRLSMERIG